MRRVPFFIVLICCALNLQAQPYFDIANIQYQYSPDEALYGHDKNHLAVGTFTAGANVPLKVNKKKDIFLINPSFEWWSLDFKEPVADDRDLCGAVLSLSYTKQWKNEKWKTLFMVINRLSGDFSEISANQWQPGGVLLVTYEKSQKLRLKLGVYYSAEFFGAFVLPLAGIDWRISDRLTLHGVVPRSMFLEYKITSKIYAGIDTKTIANTYRFQSLDPDDYIKISEYYFRVFADFYLAKQVVLNVEAGHSLLREYHERSEFRRMANLDSDLMVNDGLLVKAGIYYRFRLDESPR